MATLVFTHEFSLRYDVAATATTPAVSHVSFGRNARIDLTETDFYREEQVLWTGSGHVCFSSLKINRQVPVGERPAGLFCRLSVNLIAGDDRLSGFTGAEADGQSYISDFIAALQLNDIRITPALSDKTEFFFANTDHRGFFLGATERQYNQRRGFHVNDRSAQSIEYIGTLRPS
jgi:hypothetical protein